MQSSSTHRVRRSDIEQVSGLAFALKPYLALVGGAMIWVPEKMAYWVRLPNNSGTDYVFFTLSAESSLEAAKAAIASVMNTGAPTSV